MRPCSSTSDRSSGSYRTRSPISTVRTFWPTAAQLERLAHDYRLNPLTGKLEPVTIAYLWHSPGLRAVPEPLPPLDDDPPLPSAAEPSDHLPVMARFHAAAP